MCICVCVCLCLACLCHDQISACQVRLSLRGPEVWRLRGFEFDDPVVGNKLDDDHIIEQLMCMHIYI